VHPTISLDRRSPTAVLMDMEQNATSDDLRRDLTNSMTYARTRAIKVIRFRKDKTFLPELSKALQDDRAQVRVEAATTLAALGEPQGKAALVDELAKAKQLQKDLGPSGKFRNYWDLEDTYASIDAAGALADIAETNGYDLLKETILYSNCDACKSLAITKIAKFAQFQDRRADTVQTLLVAADDVMTKIDKCLAANPNILTATNVPAYATGMEYVEPGNPLKGWKVPRANMDYVGAKASMDVIARMLAQVGGEQAVAKLQFMAQHKDPSVRFSAEAELRAMNRRTNVPPTPNTQTVTVPQKQQSP